MVTETLVTGAPELSIDTIVHKHNVEPGAVIPVLQEIQETYGHVPPIAIQRVAEHLNIPASEIYGIVTFYAQFRLEPLGKNLVKVCHGTACHLGGAEMVAEALSQVTGVREGETSADGLFTVERVACLGCCSLAPCVMINDETHGRLTPESVSKVVSEMRRAEAPASVA
jgi:NADH-quinone oxidoreductase subunit E